MLSIARNPHKQFHPWTVVFFLWILSNDCLAIEQVDPTFYLDHGMDLNYDPLLDSNIIYPERLSTITQHYRSANYRLAILELTQIDSMNVPDGNRDLILLILSECYRKLELREIAATFLTELARDYTDSKYRVFALFRLQDFFYRARKYAQCDSMGLVFSNSV